MSTVVRPFRNDDIDFALTQTLREGWDNTAAGFQVCRAYDPEGCFVAEVEGRPVALITSTCYVQSAWVGHLIVTPDYRRQGIGEHLMAHALDHIEARGIQTVRLEGDPLGIGIYRRLGFIAQFDSLRFRKEPPHAVNRNGATPLNRVDLAAVKTFDLSCFGDDRGRLLEILLETAPAAYCVYVDRRITGFALALPSTTGIRLGPCAAENRSVAETLLNAICAAFPDRPIIAGVPSVNQSAVELLESRGFAQTPPSLRMLRGQPAAESAPDKLAAIVNGAMG